MAQKKIKITKCLFPSTDGSSTGIGAPNIKGMKHITSADVRIGKKHYEQFEFIPDHIDLCTGGNAKRVGNYIEMLK